MGTENIKYPDINGTTSYKLMVDGKESSYSHLVRTITSSCELGKISSVEIVLDNVLDEEEYLSDTNGFDINKELEVYIGYDKPENLVFKGYIIKKNLSQMCTVLTVTAKHNAEKMTKERKLRSFEDKKDSDIISEICGEYGIDAKIDATDDQHEKIVQYNCSDWDFINVRAEANGLAIYTCENTIVAKKIGSSDDFSKDPTVDFINGYNIIDLQVEIDARHSHKTFVNTSHNYSEQEETESRSSESNASQSEDNEDSGEEQKTISMSSHEDSHVLETFQNALSVRNDLAFLTGKASVVGYSPLNPGDVIRLSKVGKGFNGKVMVSSVVQAIEPGKWETHVNLGYDDTSYMEKYNDVKAQPSSGAMPGVNGLQIAKVEALEGDPLGEFRIYVRLMNSSSTKLWCRVATLDAGNERGSMFMPEIDDEVIVGFVDDNPNQSVILGMLHSSKAPSPVEIKDDNHIKGFYTREKMKLEFDDDKKIVAIETPGGNKLVISEDQKGISMEDQNGNTIVMNDQGVSIESKKALSIKAAQDVTIEGNNINIKANAQLKAQGNAAAEFSCNGNTVIKGGLVKIN